MLVFKNRPNMYQIEGETHSGPQARHMHDTEVWEEEPAPDDQAAGLAPW